MPNNGTIAQKNCGARHWPRGVCALPNDKAVVSAAHALIHYFDLTEHVATTPHIGALAGSAKGVMAPQGRLAPGFVAIVSAYLGPAVRTRARVLTYAMPSSTAVSTFGRSLDNRSSA